MKTPHSHDQYIKEQHLKISAGDMALKIGKSKTYVRKRIIAQGLKVPAALVLEFRRRKALQRSTFTPHHDKYIRENYLDVTIRQMAVTLGYSAPAVRNRMKRLQIQLPVEISLSRKRATQYKPGHKNKNKGIPAAQWMTPLQHKIFLSNQFKPGYTPQNYLPLATVVTRCIQNKKYKMIKTDRYKWEMLQRHVYREFIGPLTEDHMVMFKNGNTLDCTPGNLERITKKECMQRNMVWNYGTDIGNLILLTKKIERTINKLKD